MNDLKKNNELQTIIIKEIIDKGAIPFDKFMNLALYHSLYGYYRSEKNKFGLTGDYITAPEFSELFGICLADIFIKKYLNNKPKTDFLEFGAGNGKLATQILKHCSSNNKLKKLDNYYILELSARLKKTQYQNLKQILSESELNKIKFITTIPKSFKGVILANEVLDAMPFKCLEYLNNNLYELYVDYINGDFVWKKKLSNLDISRELGQNYIKNSYKFEFFPTIKPWLDYLYKNIDSADIFFIDYGTEEQFYYSQCKNVGSMRCFYKHQLLDNPFINIGMQDITASINFTKFAFIAKGLGYKINSYSTLADFLLKNTQIDKLLVETKDSFEKIKLIQNMKVLLSCEGFGSLFKVVKLSK